MFPPDYPFKPPAVYMITPNGRFHTNKRLCLSISDFHPDTWNPAWSVSTILVGLLSFMLEDTSTLGSIESSEREKRILAIESLLFNLKNDTFRELFPTLSQDLCGRLNEKQKRRLKEDLQKRKCKLNLFPELEALEPVTAATATSATTATPENAGQTADQDDRNDCDNADGAMNNNNHQNPNNVNSKLSTNMFILAVIIAGLVLNYVLKTSNGYD